MNKYSNNNTSTMSKARSLSKITLALFIFLFNSTNVFSQVAQASWPSTSNGNVTTSGNITATNHAFSSGLSNMTYDATYGARATNFGGTTACVPLYTRYFEYTVSPSGCNDLEITSITFTHRCSTTPRCWQLHYSIDGGTDTQIGGNINLSTSSVNYNSGALSIAVPMGSTIRLRLYGSGSTFSTFGSRNFVVNGTTTPVSSTPLVSIAASPSSTICNGTSVTFTPTPTSGGTSPTYQWYLNGSPDGTGATYVNSSLNDGDEVYCIMTSNSPCVTPPGTAASNTITMTVNDVPATPGAISGSTTVQPSTAESYSIAAVSGATSYIWTVPTPTAWTIDPPGNGGTSINTTSGLDGENGNITVSASNSCGTSVAASVLAVTVTTVLPHNNCNGCHIWHDAPTGGLTAVSGNANLCISCHKPTGTASGKPFNDGMKANPTGGTGNSHSWDKPSVNATYQTNITGNSEMLLRLPGDSVICSTCHNQHGSGYQPDFLRVDNTGDALCKDCHSARDKGTYATDPVNNKGTHPVGVNYPMSDTYLAAPTAPITAPGNKVECSSCHQMHYAPSADGNILRVMNNDNLCTSCHTYRTHKGMGCGDCHETHNNSPSNIYLIQETINGMPVVFTAESGAGSFADGDGTYNGVCEVCHTAPDPIHHTNTNDGGVHQDATNCTTCHPHEDQFYPQTNCLECHKTTQGSRRQIVDNNGDGSGTGGDYKRSSHHVLGAVPDESDCVVCHYMGDHMNGTVKLLDPDLKYDLVYTYTTGSSIENFCLNCHDADGKNGDMTPFTDGVSVPLIDNTFWSASSHKNSPYTCIDCHDNGHGSNKDKLLGPYNYTNDGSADPMNDEEEFCENCHRSGGAASTDIQAEFNRTHTHQVDEVVQSGTNSGLECISCHNPHQNTAATPVSDPDNNNSLMPINDGANGTRDFCLRCHDGAPPVGISFPASSYGTGWNKSSYVNSRHDQVINTGETNFVAGTPEDCMCCHEHHGATGSPQGSYTGIYTMIKDRYDQSSNQGSFSPNSWNLTDYQLCFNCHTGNVITSDAGAFDEHNKHVSGESAACITCHDVHRPYDSGEKGLISFEYSNSARMNVDVYLYGTYNLSTAFVESTGRCYLYCHYSSGKDHTPKTYSGTDLGYPWGYTWPN